MKPKRCVAQVRRRKSLYRWRQCAKNLPATGGYGRDGDLCYQHGVIAERKDRAKEPQP